MSQSHHHPRIIYISGYGRSGSSLLELLLAQAPGIFGAGELHSLPRILSGEQHRFACTCGDSLEKCKIWSKLVHGLQSSPLWDHMDQLALRLSHAELYGPASPHWSLAVKFWSGVINTLYEAVTPDIVVDSSKTAVPNAWRPYLLSQAGYHVDLIHIVRDRRSVVKAVASGYNRPRPIKGHLSSAKLTRSAIALMHRETANGIARIYSILHSGDRSARISYTSLRTWPLETLTYLGERLDIDVSQSKELLESGEPLPVSHHLGGNRAWHSGGSFTMNFGERAL